MGPQPALAGGEVHAEVQEQGRQQQGRNHRDPVHQIVERLQPVDVTEQIQREREQAHQVEVDAAAAAPVLDQDQDTHAEVDEGDDDPEEVLHGQDRLRLDRQADLLDVAGGPVFEEVMGGFAGIEQEQHVGVIAHVEDFMLVDAQQGVAGLDIRQGLLAGHREDHHAFIAFDPGDAVGRVVPTDPVTDVEYSGGQKAHSHQQQPVHLQLVGQGGMAHASFSAAAVKIAARPMP